MENNIKNIPISIYDLCSTKADKPWAKKRDLCPAICARDYKGFNNRGMGGISN